MQGHDARLDRLAHQRRTLPEAAEVEELQGRRAEMSTRLGLQRVAATDLEADVRKADADVAQVRTRRERDQQRLDTGAVGSPRELERLQHEVATLDRRIAVLEDAELEVMEQLEQARADLAGSEKEVAELETELADATKRREESVAELDRQGALARSERDRAVGLVPDQLLALYDKIRAQQGGVGAAALHQRRCEGCRLELNAADLRELAAEPADAVLRCPECNRLLVRTAESGL
ncbi:C4-type zinc ribbon domain-containing protein [soil metagenome]